MSENMVLSDRVKENLMYNTRPLKKWHIYAEQQCIFCRIQIKKAYIKHLKMAAYRGEGWAWIVVV